MQYDRRITITTGNNRKSINWQPQTLMLSEFYEKLRIPSRSTETMSQYLNLKKSEQDEKKDIGGFVAGALAGPRRKAGAVTGRDLITLDFDSIPPGGTEEIERRVEGLGCGYCIYSTRKHSPVSPRLRILLPFDRTVTADEYEPLARYMAERIGIEFADPTTFEATRLMYWPSCCSDSSYVCEVYDRPFCSTDGLLGMYGDWTDVSQWPQVPGAEAIARRRLARQEDPRVKGGVIGAFCRTYTITQAMDKFIPGMYEETDLSGRYTYTGGSTAGGAIVYDGDLFLYSHHATDPCSGQLVNAFDLVRLHKYGDLDAEAKDGTPVNKLPSFKAMSRLALQDKPVSELMDKERLDRAREAFSDGTQDTADEYDTEWLSKLTKDANGRFEKTINNAVIVLENDPLLKGKIATDEFASCGVVLGKLPWNRSEEQRRWKDADDAGYYRYMETFYGITGRDKLDNALLIVSDQSRINEVKEYLVSLSWDGVQRLDYLLPEYLGAEDTGYTHAVMRKSLCAAVARAVEGGVKYDNMPIFTGPQGIGKSTFLGILGKGWISESLTTFEGKEAAELIQGTWINEIGELSAFTKQETQVIKQFLSKREDIYRAAYGRRTEKYPRRCVFFGTSNDSEFLKDATGNRRFWPVDVGIHPARKSVWEDLPKEVDQIWAEAYTYYRLGEPLYLSKDIEKMAECAQEEHREASSKEGLIRDFLERKVPYSWDRFDLSQRRQYWQGNLTLPDNEPLVDRDKVCATEVWAECLGGDPKYIKRLDSLEINGVLTAIKGWKRNRSKRRYGPYGIQSGFERSG